MARKKIYATLPLLLDKGQPMKENKIQKKTIQTQTYVEWMETREKRRRERIQRKGSNQKLSPSNPSSKKSRETRERTPLFLYQEKEGEREGDTQLKVFKMQETNRTACVVKRERNRQRDF